MSVIYPDENYSSGIPSKMPGALAYDLAEEKKLIAEATEEIKKELLVKWKKRYAGAEIFPVKLSNVNPELVDFMLQFKHSLFYSKLAVDFGLNQDQREKLPQVIWEIVIRKAWQNVAQLLVDNLGLDNQKAKGISDLLFANILNEAMQLAEKPFTSRAKMAAAEPERKKVSLTLVQAIKQYPQLGESLVTDSRIKSRLLPDPIRPSVKNWINDYRENMGAGKHGSIERGNYLFHSENTKRLTPIERQRLGAVLKSLDEDTLLTIDPEKQEIIFERQAASDMGQGVLSPKPQIPKAPPRMVEQDPLKNRQNINFTPKSQEEIGKTSYHIPEKEVQFSFPQKLPVEQKKEVPEPPRPVKPAKPIVRDYLTGEAIIEEDEKSGRGNASISGKQTSPNFLQDKNDPKIKGNTVDLRN